MKRTDEVIIFKIHSVQETFLEYENGLSIKIRGVSHLTLVVELCPQRSQKGDFPYCLLICAPSSGMSLNSTEWMASTSDGDKMSGNLFVTSQATILSFLSVIR